MSTAKESIPRLIKAFADAFNKGDADAIANIYSEDAQLLVPDASTIRGRSAIADFWADGIRDATDGKLKADDVQPLGPDAALVIGTYSEKLRAPPSTVEAGKYVMLWRKIGGEWKITIDIWNSNPPQR